MQIFMIYGDDGDKDSNDGRLKDLLVEVSSVN